MSIKPDMWPTRERARNVGARPVGGVLTALSLVLSVAVAHAQPDTSASRYQPEEEDFDSREERRSGLWEQAAYPHRERYMERINRALDYMKRRDRDGDNAAVSKLREAIEMSAEEPAAYWLLARIYERNEDWPKCVANYGKVLAVDPMYQPPYNHLPRNRGATVALDLGMAICRQRTGDFEVAIDHYKRILSRGVVGEGRDRRRLREQIYRRLGESYMALGRLSEAIDALETATRQRLRTPLAHYSLAVAYDRDEQVAEARQALQLAFSYDPSLSALSAPSTWLSPASDTLYYLALAHTARSSNAWAVAYFRQYRQLVGDTAWSRRARQHLRDLAGEPLIAAARVRIDGTALEPKEAAQAIARARDPLMQCMADVPGLLLEVRLTALGREDRRARKERAKRKREAERKRRAARRRAEKLRLRNRRRAIGVMRGSANSLLSPFGSGSLSSRRGSAVVAGVRSTELYSFSTTPEQTKRARECVESAAMKIAIERPKGGAGSYRSVIFPLIAVPTAAEVAEPTR